jgi:hypothetical protein
LSTVVRPTAFAPRPRQAIVTDGVSSHQHVHPGPPLRRDQPRPLRSP